MDPYDRKLREMQQYLPFLEEKIERMKKIKLKIPYPDPVRERKLNHYQKMYRLINNRDIRKRTNLETLDKFEELIKKIQKQDSFENRRPRSDILPKTEYNHYHGELYRPGSSSSSAIGSAKPYHKSLYDDTPASPSPPHSPADGDTKVTTAPIIIPTERRSRYTPATSPVNSKPPSPTFSRYLLNEKPTPPIELPKIVPIPRIDAGEVGPLEWDSDDDREANSSMRQEIHVPKLNVTGVLKKLTESYPCKEEIKSEYDMWPKIPKRENEPKHPSENIPTVEVRSLGGSRRLKSVIEKTNLLSTDLNRLLSSHRPPSPLTNVPEEGLRSPDPDILMNHSPNQQQQQQQTHFSPTRREAPKTPSLLLNAPPTNSRLPIALDDIAEYLDDNERNSLRRLDNHSSTQKPNTGPRPSSRILLPMSNSSPIMLSPRSDASSLSPCLTDLRMSGDPRSRASNPHRIHGMGSVNSDPRNHGPMPSNDPRGHSNVVPRYADNYERHKRTVPRETQESMGSNDYQRQRHIDQFGQENSAMGPPIHGMSNSGPGPGTYNAHNQMGSHKQMNYDYRGMGSSQDNYNNPNVVPVGQMQSSQQQWNGPSHMHIQQGPPQSMQAPSHSYQISQASSMRGPPDQSSWQNPNMYTDMSGHSMMNGDSRFSNQMQSNMGRSNPNHMQSLMSNNNNNFINSSSKYPNYSDNRQQYDMQYEHQSQSSNNDFQRIRPSWNNRMSGESDRFQNRSNPQFARPTSSNNSWNSGKDQSRVSRDPRDPRMRSEVNRPLSPPFPAKDALLKNVPPGKEVHPNKLAKQAAAAAAGGAVPEKDTITKKRPDHHKLDVQKTKDKDKDRDRDRDRDKDREKERDRDKSKDKDKDKDKFKTKTKSMESMKSPLTELYGTIDAKKAVKGPGLQKFKIPKKRPSIEVRPEPTSQASEENWDDNDVVTSSSTSHEPSKETDSTVSKKSTKPDKGKEKGKSTDKETESSSDATEDRKKSKGFDEISLLKKLAETDNLSKDDLSSLVKELMKKLKKKKTKTVIYTSDEDAEEETNDERSPSSTTKKTTTKKKKKKTQYAIIDSTSDESESDSERTPISKKTKSKKKPTKSPNESKEENQEKKKVKEKKTVEKKVVKPKAKPLVAQQSGTDDLSDSLSTTAEKKDTADKTATETSDKGENAVNEEPVKTKPKRRFRELDMLQEDLKSSWICDGAMKATGSRTCSQKQKTGQSESLDEEPASIPAKNASAGKAKKPQKPKPGPKPKKSTTDANALPTSDSEEDNVPLSRRSESIGIEPSAGKSKKDTTPKSGNKKITRAKSIQRVPPPLFDSSSNDSFNLDPSVVEPTTDISLHPDTNATEKVIVGKAKNLKKGSKKAADAAAESSSDESFVSNASSSLLLDTSTKQRDNNEELLDDVMAELAANPKYSMAKKKQVKKKKNNWQMGILSRKKKKKAAVSNKADESTSHESVADSSFSNETDTLSKESDTTISSGEKKLHLIIDRTESADKLDEYSRWKSSGHTNDITDEDVTSRVDAEALIGYTLCGNDKYQCLLCTFYRKNIVHHYKMMHPKKEVLISRLPVAEATLALEESKLIVEMDTSATEKSEALTKYSCRFCSFVTKGIDSCARESFYEHCTNHTGEYRFSCNNCSYEAVAKGSIRTHYYKECRKYTNTKNYNETIIETPLPNEDRVYGYLCTKCNYIQLKRSNVEKHVKTWHSKNPELEVKIVKIDMSLKIKKEEDVVKVQNEIEDSKPFIPNLELKNEKDLVGDMTLPEYKDIKQDISTDAIEAESIMEESEIRVMLETTEIKPQKLEKSSNLSAFVCAEELEDKEVEIQNERKKKMQEIAENIGIKVDKDEAQKRLSIIDKLKDKMDTSLPTEEKEMVGEKVDIETGELNITSEVSEETAVDPLHIPEQEIPNAQQENATVAPESVKIKEDPDAAPPVEEDKAGTKIIDPLSFVDEPAKNRSDEEPSDTEAPVAPVHYDSESSPEQSDHEIPTDVTSILQNTGEIGSPSKGLMMTTIQRLAAQLQNTKPLETGALPEAEPVIAELPEAPVIKKEIMSPPKKAVDNMAVLSPINMKKEPHSPTKENEEEQKTVDEESASVSKPPSPPQSPKTFIRIRRISGDKLSKGGNQESTSNESESSSALAIPEAVDSNTNEDTGFLKIANVVSLAQKDSETPMVSNLRKAVETSPQKVKGLSLLKKPNSYILKRVDSSGSVISTSGETVKLIPLNIPPAARPVAKPENYISIGGQPTVAIKIDSKGVATPLTVSSSGSTPTSLVTSANQPFKIVKIAAPEHLSVAIKLKSANVYEKMLKEDKLTHIFKCMGRDCYFSTSNEPAFNKHLRLHEDDIASKYMNADSKDYFKCAYCYIDCKSYEDLMAHLKQMHVFCRYCCKYCFYRAFAYSYVEIHQKTYHQMKRVHILAVNEEHVQLPPPPKRLDRKQIIKPYVCIHDCNKYFFIPEAFVLHLSMHHTNITSGFKCHICQSMVPTIDNLIEHYKQHGYFKYHCLYCPHGSATIKELHSHLSTAHYNQPPRVLERCLPREISKNVSAIDQLRVRDVDAIYRQRKGNFDEEHSKVAIPALMKNSSSPVSLIQSSPIMTAKIIAPKDTSTFVPLTSLDNNSVSNIRILDTRSLSSNTATSLLNIGKNIKVTMSDTPTYSSQMSSYHRIDTDTESEFVNTNLLDHTELLSGRRLHMKSIEEPKETPKKVDYDSDVEIIGDYPSQLHDSSQEKDIKPFINKEGIKEELMDDSRELLSCNESEQEQSESSLQISGTESATEAATGQNTPSEGLNTSGRFLCLEDIKDTGYEGRELYRCGVDTCTYSSETAEELRQHMQQCSPNEEETAIDPSLYCVHCGPTSKRFSKPSFFLDHLKTHGLKRFSCALCSAKFAVQSQAQSHLRAKHKYVSSKILPADPANPSPNGLFHVHPLTTADRLKNKKISKCGLLEKEPMKPPEMEKLNFSPSEIGKLPLQAIYMRAVQCAVCPYSNKVRTNMVRHLQAHLKDETVPESSPVNPVPCLDKKERMFDKMVNLASSSHENGRMSGGGAINSANKDAIKLEEEELPKYIPENQRYVCGVPECNYLTVEEAMLRHHLKALHSDEVYFRCPHCPPPSGQDLAQNIALEKMGVHLKMHDSRLYKCSHCIYHHYHRHVVERHLADKHPEKRQFVKVIREMQPDQAGEAQQQQTSASQESEETELPDPDGNTWKCNLCDFKSVYKTAMQNHAATTHDEKCQFKCNGCSFKTISKITFDQHMLTKHVNEPEVDYTTVYQRIKGLKKPDAAESMVPQDEPFDTTPLWRRDMPRIRHIRGILLEEEEENNQSTKSAKRKTETEPTGKPKPKVTKAPSSTTTAIPEDCKSPDAKRQRTSLDEAEKPKPLPEGGFGPLGKPLGDFYVCTVCNQFKSKYKHDFRDHLYRDLKYTRWHCPACEYKAVNRGSIMKHCSNRHSNETLEARAATPNAQIEEWVAAVVKTQTEIMKNAKPVPLPVPTVEDEEDIDAESDDEDDLVIDTKEEEEEEEDENSDEEKDEVSKVHASLSSEVLSVPLVCKHCNTSFIKWRGFKRHVQLKHLQRLGFLCPYCDRSTNSEAVMYQHVRSKHKTQPVNIISNPNPQARELSPGFWEREYGLVVPKRPKKRKRRDENPEDGSTKIDHELPCDKCDFTAMNNAGLKSHLRTHEVKVKQKCTYCTFSNFNSSEMRQHWEVNHPHLEFKIEEAIVTTATDAASVRAVKKSKLEDEYKATVYNCFYCDTLSLSLETIRSHWKLNHKEDAKSSVFKYKEHTELKAKCAYCAESGTKSTLIEHIWQKHGRDKDILLVYREDESGWMCKWCKDEFFMNKEDMDYHQKVIHSQQLRSNYKLVRRGFACKFCGFDTMTLDVMQKHAKNHLNIYKCKFCPDAFKTLAAVKGHSKLLHPDKEFETRTMSNEDLGKEIEVIVNDSMTFSNVRLTPIKVPVGSPNKTPPVSPSKGNNPTSPRVAKKSTTKQSITAIRPLPGKIKAVARKSTNPLPRYPTGVVFKMDDKEEEERQPRYVSYYGRSSSPVDLSSLSTTMAVAGLKMKVNCSKLAEIFNINIEPRLKLRDFRKEMLDRR